LQLESKAVAMAPKIPESRTSEQSEWGRVSPLLDEGLSRLRQRDRDVLLWRFFESRSVVQIAEALGISEHAASKRVTRAVDRLRDFFSRRGVSVSSATLGAILATNVSEAAPAALASAVSSTTALGAGTTAAAIANGALIMAATTKLKMGVIAAIVALLLIGGGAAVVKSMYSGGESRQRIGDVAAAPARQAPAPGAVTFADGTVVQILGIAEGENRADKWWAADGSPVADPKFPGTARVSVGQPEGLRPIQFIIDMSGSSQDKALTVEVPGARGSAMTAHHLPGGRITKLVTALPADQPTTNLRIGVSHGPWTNTVIWRKDSEVPADTPGPKVMGIRDEDGETVIEVERGFASGPRPNLRMIVIARGNELNHAHMSGSRNTEVYRFRCAMEQVEQVVHCTRPFEWQQIENVSLVKTK
jgi:Sigma-70, region 4